MKAFSIVAALATAVQAGALIMLHLLPTGYHPVRDAVSVRAPVLPVVDHLDVVRRNRSGPDFRLRESRPAICPL
jgi:hypothetical protein